MIQDNLDQKDCKHKNRVRNRYKGSDEASLILAKNGKAFRDGETIKKWAIKMALAFGDTKMAKKFETVPLSHQTVARRVMEK